MLKHWSAGLVAAAALLFSDLAGAQCTAEIARFDYSGTIQLYGVPYNGTFWIEVAGAEGGHNTNSTTASGKGAYIGGSFSLTSGTQLKILAGQQPTATSGNGGGGGSFVTLADNTPLIVAGGGGGSSQGADSPAKDGQIGTSGGTGAGAGGAGGTAGSGGGIGASGFQSGAGGGLLTNGADGWSGGTGGAAFVNGGSGGTTNAPANGGFGGGGSGSSYVVGGGGGGYSGGGSGGNSTAGVGGGGGSFNSGTNQNNQAGVNSGSGYVRVCTSVTLAPASLPDATVGVPYDQPITGSGGVGPYTFAVTSGSLPAGLTLSSDGVLSGTPMAGGPFNFTITATDASSATGQQSYALTVDAPTITLTPATLPDATQSSSYAQALTASGGTATYTYAVTSGALPDGITLSTDGLLSGTPTGYGSFGFSVTATDSSTGTGPFAGTSAYTLLVTAAKPVISPTVLPAATFNSSYSQAITASSGNPAYTFSISAGTLPAGLSLDSGGLLSGTPTAAGTYPFTVQVIDAASSTATQSYSFSVDKAGTVTNVASDCQTQFVENQPFTFVATVSGTATGSVDFFNGATNVCAGVAVVSASASCTVNNLAAQGQGTASTLTLTAAYTGDANYSGSISPDFNVIVLSAADVVFRGGFEAESIDCPIE
jgi:hypothetical protein